MSNEDIRNIYRIEQLYYMLQYDPYGEGKRLWFDLVALDNDDLNKLLVGEIKDYKTQFDPETRYEIHSRVAQMEFRANHRTQAKGEYAQMHELGKAEKRNDWIAAALIGDAYCEKDLNLALQKFDTARNFCEEYNPTLLPKVYNMIGYTYRRMYKIGEAVEWYQKAQQAFQANPWDVVLGARIVNDLGYAYSIIGEWAECRESVKEGQEIRQSRLLQLEQEVARLETELKSATDKETIGKLRDNLNREKHNLDNATLELGLSYSTLGEVYRYDNDLDASLRNYTQALELFERVHDYTWQVKAYFSRGETYRRLARTRYWETDEVNYYMYLNKAKDDIEESIRLCKKYQVIGERDTANRRIGRVLHDLAMYELKKGNNPQTKIVVRDYLEQARSYFEEGLRYAQLSENKDALEELSNLSELAFIVDDFMDVVGPDNVPAEFRNYLAKFKDALDNHRDDQFRIYQFSVFDNLYKLAKAATDLKSGNHEEALKGYLDAYIGLASDPGYGQTRFKQHFSHLIEQISGLPSSQAAIWCRVFIEAWEKTPIKGKPGRTLAQDIRRPDLVIWCRRYLNQLKMQGGMYD